MNIEKLTGFSVSVDGRGYVGEADITLPSLELKTETAPGGAADFKIQSGGLSEMDAALTFESYPLEVLKRFGVEGDTLTPLTARGSIRRPNGVEVPVLVQMRGLVYQLSGPEWKRGEGAINNEVTVGLRYYRLEVDGEELVEVDAVNHVRRIGGVDQLEAYRTNIGL
ncbi:MAG: phage major tail tube protein [Candidatus Thiodiazotropha sp. (ex Dulcina madagascariensis)]|nr:phage major tail tube protein [Candidatus Thiodiazotropha sp. (ex Dulcina madagascariensis)]